MGAMQNEWLTGYLEAILDTGEEDLRSCDISQNDSPAAKYFVATVTGYDEKSLFHSWSQATVARNGLSRAGRLENMCWRIWHLARRKRQLGVEEGRRAAKRQTEEDKSLNEAIEDMSEDLSEAEKAYSSENEIKLARSSSDSGTDTEPLPRPERRLYVVLISLHGLVRGDNMELGRDSDTGGQVKYVVELARALAQMPEVYRVDLLTRQICAPNVDWSYAEPTEMLTGMDAHSEAGESSGAYIVRIPCGPTDKYLPKECLWPYIQEFVDGALAHVLWMSKVLGKQANCGHNVWPHVIHGHYADAGDIAALLSGALSVPMVLTGHSLGRNKLEQLLKQGKKSEEDINSTYKIMRRIEAEELSLDAAELVITSTSQEINEQWGIYDGYDVKLEKKLRARAKKGLSCHGRYMPLMAVIPPGMDFSHVVVQDAGDVFDTDVDTVSFTGSDASVLTPMSPRADPQIWGEIMKFLSNPHKPMILALARPDPKKNIPTLINAFGSCKQLRELANLTLIMGNREELDDMSAGNAAVLKTMFQLIDKYDLYGQVAYPKKHKQSEVPDIYRLAAKTKGVFVNPALVEPFGLTLIEAAAHGLPLVATKNGGPNDILQALGNGILVDPHDHKSISEALLKLVSDRTLWNECRRKGLKNIHLYSWPEHCRKYLDRIALCRMRHPQWQTEPSPDGDAETESQGDSIGDIRDLRLSIDGERLGGSFNKECAELVRSFSEAKAAGRRSQGKLEPMKEGNEAGSDDHVDGHTNGGMDGHTNGGMDGHTNGGMDGHTNGGMDGHTNGGMDGHTNGGMDGDRDVLMDGDTNGHRDEVGHRGPVLRTRKRLIIIAVDAYSASGELTPGFIDIVRGVLKDVKSGCQYTGVVLSTSLSISEVEKFLDKAGLEANDFDAFISSSGSELYYPSDPTSAESRFLLDPHYVQHIEYRWGGEGLKKTMARYIAGSDVDKEAKAGKGKRALEEDDERSNAHCLVYEVTNQSIAPAVGDLRMHLRCRGLRCHVVYCQAATKLHLLPLLASRSQALRYFFVRWGVDVARMVLLVGETGDTDYEEMLSGTHKTVILSKGVETGSETLLRARRGCTRDDFYDRDSPNVITLDEYNSERVQEVVEQVEWKSQ